MRPIICAGLLSLVVTGTAMASSDLAGEWRDDLGHGFTIDRTLTPDGHWSSEVRQQNDVLREIEGTYEQQASGEGQGTIVFTPTEAAGGVVARTETDRYWLGQDGQQLSLSSEGKTVVFTRRR